jgi:hypothetical protein
LLRLSEQNGYTRSGMPPARLHARQAVRSLWNIARLPILLPLVILEPVVAFLLGGLALLGLLMTAFFTLIAAPHFPAGLMVIISISFALALVLYEGAMGILSS